MPMHFKANIGSKQINTYSENPKNYDFDCGPALVVRIGAEKTSFWTSADDAASAEEKAKFARASLLLSYDKRVSLSYERRVRLKKNFRSSC